MKKKYIAVIVFTAFLSASVVISIGARRLGEYVAMRTISDDEIQTTQNSSIDIGNKSTEDNYSTSYSANDPYQELLDKIKEEGTVFGGDNVGGNNPNNGGILYDLDGKPVTTFYETETTKSDITTDTNAPEEPQQPEIPENTEAPAVTKEPVESEAPKPVTTSTPATESETTVKEDEVTTKGWPYFPFDYSKPNNTRNEPIDNSQAE